MSDGVINLQEYLEEKDGERKGSFSIWGGEGERSHLALPIWRATYLAGGDWAALLWGRKDHVPRSLKPFFVLDLANEPARTSVEPDLVDGLWSAEAPTLRDRPPSPLCVFLGAHGGKHWFLAISGSARDAVLEPGVREDLIFLAGECAGLLFCRDLANT